MIGLKGHSFKSLNGVRSDFISSGKKVANTSTPGSPDSFLVATRLWPRFDITDISLGRYKLLQTGYNTIHYDVSTHGTLDSSTKTC